MKRRYLYLLIVAAILSQTQNIRCIKSEATEEEIISKVFDRATGTLYLGLNFGAGTNAISAAKRFNGVNITANLLTGVAHDDLSSAAIEFLSLATSPGNKDPLLAIVKKGNDEKEQTKVIVMSKNGQKISEIACDLLDASDLNENGEITAGIINIAANKDYIFAAVRPNGGDFGETNGGIAVVKINKAYLGHAKLNPDTLQQTAAKNDIDDGPDTGIKAKTVEPNIFELTINSVPTIEENNLVSLHWSENLKRLYIGISQITSGEEEEEEDNAGTKSVIVAQVNSNGSLTFYDIADDSAFTQGATNEIVGVIGAEESLSIHNLRTMHTSTGRDYLIVNGDNGQLDTTGNKIYALPLLNRPSNPIRHGTLATRDFLGPAVNSGDPGDLTKSTEIQAIVGGGDVPINANETISDIVVIGDTVYVSINVAQDANNEPGVFYSQATFDEDGIIERWTKWAKRAFPFYPSEYTQRKNNQETPFEDIPEEDQGRVKFFAVDAGNGKVWAVEGSTAQAVGVTKWERIAEKKLELCPRDETRIPLVKRLNEDLPEGCFSVLDLDKTTNGIGQNSPGRYALFGGLNKVILAKISEETDDGEIVIDDFSKPENYLKTTLPKSGCVTCLEYARTDTNQNYFFAGTQNGLYVYTNDFGEGFTDGNLNDLNDDPFTERKWHKIKQLSDPIIDIKTSGNKLYVLTLQTSKNLPIRNILYSIPFAANADDMFNNMTVIAESGKLAPNSDLSKAKIITAIGIFTADEEVEDEEEDDGEVAEQLVLSTNNGIYLSNAAGAQGIIDATNQEEALWDPINENDTSMYNDIFSIGGAIEETIMPSTMWPTRVVDTKNCKSYSKNSITQLNWQGYLEGGTKDPTFVPKMFNAKKLGDDSFDKNFETYDPIHYFWSDGARRFFIIQRAGDPCQVNRLFVIPYDVDEWCVKNPATQMIADPFIKSVKTFFWVKDIGASGIVMTGVDNGVVALQ